MMEFIVSENQLEYLLEQDFPVKVPIIIKLFSLLNKEKKKTKKKSELISGIEKLLPYFNIPKKLAFFLVELYILNYREDGDYSNLNKDNFVDPRKLKGGRTTNEKSDLYTKAQMPFKGSNLEAYWSEDYNKVPYYIVKSYGWYPIYIFKEGRWYENIEKYSSSTSKQMRNSNPVRYNDELESKIYLLTREELEMLQRNSNHDQIMKNKLEILGSKSGEFLDKKKKSDTNYAGNWNNKYKVKYKIDSIDTSGEKGIITVNIYDVVKVLGNVAIPTPENYLKNELGPITKEKVESDLERTLNEKFKRFVGRRIDRGSNLPEDSQIEYRFNHLKDQK